MLPSHKPPFLYFPSAPKGKLDAIQSNRCLGSQVTSCTLSQCLLSSLRSDGVSYHPNREDGASL